MTEISDDLLGYTMMLEPWEYDFWKDHLERNEEIIEEDEENEEFVAAYSGKKEIFWYGSNDGTSAWLRTFTLETDLDNAESYLERVNENRVPVVEQRSREEYGLV